MTVLETRSVDRRGRPQFRRSCVINSDRSFCSVLTRWSSAKSPPREFQYRISRHYWRASCSPASLDVREEHRYWRGAAPTGVGSPPRSWSLPLRQAGTPRREPRRSAGGTEQHGPITDRANHCPLNSERHVARDAAVPEPSFGAALILARERA